ncbi:MAG: GIY-YIG nuclease family protein [Planctomycetales bacterium]|nr:GIY-YIG nuclease family protein [Planctomycetales bacterium]
MYEELDEDVFVGFGEDAFFPYPRTGLSSISGNNPQELRDAVKSFAPRSPGVYGMIDVLGRLIYVGKSKLLRNRLLSYFLPNNEEDKSGRIVQSSATIVWEPQPSEFAALLREQYLIRHFQPRFNVQGLPKRQQPVFICLGRRPAEQLYTTRKLDTKANTQLGPLFGASRANRAVDVLNRLFRLRDCSNKQPCSFADQLQLFDIQLRPGCIRLEIDTCLGPCIAACSRSSYDRHVALARSFLLGQDTSCIDILQQQMQAAARSHHFERAAVLREDMKAVQWLANRAADLAKARDRYTFVYPVSGVDCCRKPGQSSSEYDVWYLIRRGVLEGALAAPRSPAEKQRTRIQLREWLKHDKTIGTALASPRPETLALVTSWFRNNSTELKRTFVPGKKRAPGIANRIGRPRAASLQASAATPG